MKKRTTYLIPRIAGIASCLLLEIYVLISNGFTSQALVENVFVSALVIALVLAWKWPLYGGIAYSSLALLYFIRMTMNGHLWTALIISIPLIVLGVLFILDWERE